MATSEATDRDSVNITSEVNSNPNPLMKDCTESSTARLMSCRSSTTDDDISQTPLLSGQDRQDAGSINLHELVTPPREFLEMQEADTRRTDQHPEYIKLLDTQEAGMVRTNQQQPNHEKPLTTETGESNTDQQPDQVLPNKYRIFGTINIVICIILCFFSESFSIIHIYKITEIVNKSLTDYFCMCLDGIITVCSLTTFSFLFPLSKQLPRLPKLTLAVCLICTVCKIITSRIIYALYPDDIIAAIFISSIGLLVLLNAPVLVVYFVADSFVFGSEASSR
ncbi:hypothetical protein Ahia01_000608500 [Argonauta hians]